MKFSDRIHYHYSRADMLRIFSNTAFFAAKYAATGAREIQIIESRKTDTHFLVKVSRKVPTEVPVPSFARGLVPQEIILIQTDRWDLENARGSLDIEFVGIPVEVSCELSLSEVSGKAVEDLLFDIRVNLPLIGGKLEKLLSDDLRMKFARDTEITLDLVAEYL